MGAVGAGRGLWGHGQGRSPLPCKQFRPPDPRGQERTPPAPWAPLRNQKHREGVGIRRWSPLAPRPRPSRPGPAPRPPRLQPRPPIMAANLWLILGLLASHSSDLEWCQSKPRHLPQLWMMSPVTQAPPHLPLTTAAVREAPPTAVTTPIQNLHIDPAHYTLSWDPAPGADITTGAFCRKGRDIFVWADPGLARCSFQSLSLCHVTNFTVFLGKDRAVAGSIQFPPDDDGDHEAAAQDLRCWVHEGQLSCQWERGPKATGDVHYRMFWRDVRSPSPSTAVAALAPCPAWTTLWTCSAQVSIPHFWVPNAGAISFRVKSRSEVYPRKLSSWSEAWGLVCPPEVMPVKTALVTSVATVLGAGLVAAGLLLWWRKSLLYRLCPPIPRLRLPLAGEMVVWEPALEDCEVTPVTDA
ncbi:interleukin-3 receptor subunit alpha isoform X11 [Mus musculus]|uniref:interleukin-3 receptor subunit alpha isoform X11 n=1 Tax=Mus musculus TaxID=10090 RepID=UPI0003D78320|nr:interleukin-3 receptor subunit alpha isoform X11 [Mus musculus]|eukprot:XP_017171355.1 PREDICTED: interleukin-3 receptor subunit alpha isoform X8 [Mus musculus]